MRWTNFFAPVLSVFVLTVIAALPWGLPADDRFFLPLLPVVAIYCCTSNREAWLPEWAVFGAGLILDILSQGPLGYWALIYLVAHVIATLGSRAGPMTAAGQFGSLAGALVAVAVVAWAVASLYFFEVLDWTPYATGTLFACIGALLLAPLFKLFDTPHDANRNVTLSRGM